MARVLRVWCTTQENGPDQWPIYRQVGMPEFCCAAAAEGWDVFLALGSERAVAGPQVYLRVRYVFDVRVKDKDSSVSWNVRPACYCPFCGARISVQMRPGDDGWLARFG